MPECSYFNMFWIPDQVRYDENGTFCETVKPYFMVNNKWNDVFSLIERRSEAISSFDIGRSMFDVRCSQTNLLL